MTLENSTFLNYLVGIGAMRFFGTSFEQICPWLRHGLAAPAKFHRCLVFLPSTVREIIESHTNTNEGNSRDQMGETPANFCRNRPSASRPPWRRAAPQLAPPGRPAWPAGALSRPPPPPGWWWERNGVLCGRRRGLYAGEVRRESSRGADDVGRRGEHRGMVSRDGRGATEDKRGRKQDTKSSMQPKSAV